MTPGTDGLAEGLTRLLAHADLQPGQLDARLDEAIADAQALLGADGAGLMLLSPSGQLRLAGATNPAAEALERAQIAIGEGPGVEATRRRTVVSVSDLRRDPRWPELSARVEQHGVRAVLSVPIWLYGRPAGNLNLLCRAPREWSRADGQALSAFAGVLTAFLRIAVDARHSGDVVDRLRAQASETPSRPT
jgi:GAF domain-containing protein